MITLCPKREKSILRHHPWVFGSAIKDAKPEESGKIHDVVSSDNQFIGWGFYDANAHIPLRMLTYSKDEYPNVNWWKNAIRESIKRRASFFSKNTDTTVFRIIHGEADFLPGVSADIYNRTIRVIISAKITYIIRQLIIDELTDFLNPDFIVLTTDPSFCNAEKMPEVTEYYVNKKKVSPEENEYLTRPVEIRESGILYHVIPGKGQKSGFYCDQRDNRNLAERYAADADVLDLCCYTGAFTFHALRGGAKSVTSLDISKIALNSLENNLNLNISRNILNSNCAEKVTLVQADVFQAIQTLKEDKYNMIILDPPKMAKTVTTLNDARRGYKELNRIAMQRIRKDGILVTCSCTGLLKRDEFRTILAYAAKDSKRNVRILHTSGQGEDHPVLLSFPESEYLKVYVLHVS